MGRSLATLGVLLGLALLACSPVQAQLPSNLQDIINNAALQPFLAKVLRRPARRTATAAAAVLRGACSKATSCCAVSRLRVIMATSQCRSFPSQNACPTPSSESSTSPSARRCWTP